MNLIGSDHLIIQIAIQRANPPTKTHIPWWNFQKANWHSFSDLCDMPVSSIISTELEQTYCINYLKLGYYKHAQHPYPKARVCTSSCHYMISVHWSLMHII